MIVLIVAPMRIERRFQHHHLRQRNDSDQVVALRRGEQRLELLQLRHGAVDAQLTAVNLHHRRDARLVKIDAETLRPFGQLRRQGFAADKVQHQLLTQTTVLRQHMQQPRLLQHHLRRHADQLAVVAQRDRIAGQSNHPDDFTVNAQRQIDAWPHAVQMFRHRLVDVHYPPLRQHQQRAFVQFANTLAIAAADNAPARIHHVDITVNNLHGARHDILREARIKMIGCHLLIPTESRRDSIRMAAEPGIVQMHRARGGFTGFAALVTL